MKHNDKNIQVIPSKQKGEKKATIILENELTIFTIEKLKNKMLETFEHYDTIEFNLKKVHNIDLTFIQLLFSLKNTAQKRNKKISLQADISEDIRLLLNNADLNKVLI